MGGPVAAAGPDLPDPPAFEARFLRQRISACIAETPHTPNSFEYRALIASLCASTCAGSALSSFSADSGT
jgi:hypothetical protein